MGGRKCCAIVYLYTDVPIPNVNTASPIHRIEIDFVHQYWSSSACPLHPCVEPSHPVNLNFSSILTSIFLDVLSHLA